MSKEKNLLKVSAIANELLSLANDLDSMGEREAADAVDRQLAMFKEAADKLYDVTKETGEKFIGDAHPGGGPTMVPAKEDGGKVETIVEQQKKDVEVANKVPTGKYAETIMRLIATANRLEDEGNTEAAAMVDKAIEELRQAALPFADRNLASEVTGSRVAKTSGLEKKAGIAASEDIVGDMKNINLALKDAAPSLKNVADALAALLRPHLETFINHKYLDINDKKDAIQAYRDVRALKSIMKEVAKYATIIKEQSSWTRYLGYSILNDYVNSLNEDVSKLYQQLKVVGGVTEEDITKADSEKAQQQQAGGKQAPGAAALSAQTSELPQLNAYKNSLVRLQAAFKNPKNLDALLKALGGGNANRGTDILPQRQQWVVSELAWISKLLGKKYEEGKINELEALGIKKNRSLWQNFIKPLQQWGAIAIASSKPSIAKKAADPPKSAPTATPTVAPPPGTRKTTTKPGAGRPAERDPQVEALQKALNGAGIAVKEDGLWGPRTAQAYNDFISKNIGVEKYLQPIANPKAQRHANRPVAVLPKAVNIVRYLAGREKDAGTSIIELGGGISVPLEAMTSPQGFVEHLQSTLNSATFPPSSALQYLGELERYVGDNAMEMEGKQAGTARMWQQAIRNLTQKFQQLERQAKGNKAFQYPWQQGQQGQRGQQEGKPGSDLINPFPERGGAGTQSGQTGGVRYLGFGGNEGGQVDFQNLRTLDDITRAVNAMPPISMLTYERFQDAAGSRDLATQKRHFHKISDQLTKLVQALLRMRQMKANDPLYQRIYQDTGVYRTELENLGRSLRI